MDCELEMYYGDFFFFFAFASKINQDPLNSPALEDDELRNAIKRAQLQVGSLY